MKKNHSFIASCHKYALKLKLPLVMRISLILLFSVILQLSAENGYAQRTRIPISINNASIEQVLNKIEESSDFVFLYNDKTIQTDRIVTVRNKNGKITDILNEIFRGTNIVYTVIDKQIILSTNKLNVVSQNPGFQLKGIVKDAKGEPLIGVNVKVKGAGNGTITDFDGKFVLQVAKGDILEISYVGYTPQSIKVSGEKLLDIVLNEDTKVLNEVVVTALGIKREQKALSYNVQQIKADELTTVKDANFMNSLAGKVAGVEINSGATGAGGATRVVMRGMKSITKDNNALYVIDGVPMFNTGSSGGEGPMGDMGGTDAVADLNPDDIESINMMTGPSAAALYGSAAANGVVLINTKKGQKEKTTITISNSTTFSKAYIMPEMQNKYGTSSGMYSWGSLTEKRYDPEKFFNTGSNIINSISLSTGNQKNQTYLSVSTTNSDGILPNNSYNRYNFTGRNTTTFAQDKLVLDIGANYIVQNNRNMVAQGQYYNPLPALYLFPRGDDFEEVRLYERYDTSLGYMSQYWPYDSGSLDMQNPYWVQNRIVRESSKKRYMLNASLKWNMAKWINLTGRVSLDNADYRNRNKLYASTLTTFSGLNGGYNDIMKQERSLYMDALLNIDRTFGDFRLYANIGTSLQHRSMEYMGYAGDLKIANFFALNNIDYDVNYKPRQEGWEEEIQSVFASAELGWKSMLYLTLTGRNDWDSKLAFSNNKSFFYPSVGMSAILTEMFKLPEIISYAKIRGSYTIVASSFERFLTNPGYEYDSQTHNWTNPTTYPAENLKPEKTKSWEVGLNAKFWDNRFNLDVTYYRSNTLNQTFYVDIPATSGYSRAIVQTGNVQNQGLEMGIGYNERWGDFSWNSNATFTLNRNKVIRLAGGATNPVTGEVIEMPEMKVGWLGSGNIAPQVILTEGGTMTDIYVYNHLKTDNNGNLFVNSQTGNMSIVTSDTPRKVGNLAPKYNLGWSNNFNYKGINLGIVLSARIGGLAYSATQGILDYYGVSKTTAVVRDNGGIWINNGYVDAKKYYQTIGTGSGGYGQYYLYDATNVRLQELSLNYTLPSKWLNNIAKVTVGVIGRNLWMIYSKAPFDPELSASTSSNYYMNVDYFMQPSLRNVGFNVKVQF